MQQRQFTYPHPTDLTVVVRSAGERTEGACVASLRRQAPDIAQVEIVRAKPFSEAVLRTFELGLESGRPWVVAVDADLILLEDAFERAREICGKMAPDAFCATPIFLCRTVGGFAMRGLHCYRASLIPEALSLAPGLPDDLRPESRYHDAMRSRGYSREVYAKVLGLHEYEQSFRHIYLKSLLRARKDPYADQIESRLRLAASSDPDSRVALWGFKDAAAGFNQPCEYDWNAPLPQFEERLAREQMTEKQPLRQDGTRGLALRTIISHRFEDDEATEPWIRDMLGFQTGGHKLLEQVQSPPRFTNARALGEVV